MQPHVYRFAMFLLFLLFLGSLPMQVVGLQDFQNISAHGAIVYPLNNILIYRADSKSGFSYEESRNASLLADNLDMYTTKYYPSQGETVKQIHQKNPNTKCLLYRNMRTIYNYSAEWQTALENGWLLRDSSDALIYSTRYPENYMVDIGNQEYRDFIVQWLNNYFDLYHFDGVFADNCLAAWSTEWWWGVTAQPINPRTGELYTTEELLNNEISFINYVKDRIGNKLWISNGIFHGHRFFKRQDNYMRVLTETSIDGFMSEGLFNTGSSHTGSNEHYSEEKWKKSVDFVAWLQDNWLNQPGKIFCPHGRCLPQHLPVDCTQEQTATFVFSSLLLGVNRSQNYLSLQGAMLLDEVQNLFKINLGIPKGNYYLIEGTHVYARDFTKIKVLVNPTDQPYSVYLDGYYETLEGQIVSSVNAKPHTGLILKAMPS